MEFTLDTATVLQIIATTILPIIVGFVTTRVTDRGVKATILAGLTLVASLLAEALRAVQAGEVYDLGVALLAAIPAFAVSVALHYGLWDPTGLAKFAADHVVTPSDPIITEHRGEHA